MFVLNLPHGDTKAQGRFLEQLETLRASLESDPEELTLPHLIVVRRDAPNKQFNDKELIRQIEEFGLFQNDTAFLNMVLLLRDRPTPAARTSRAATSWR